MKIKKPLAFWLAVVLLCVVSAPVTLANQVSPALDSGLSDTSDSGMSFTSDVTVLSSFDKPYRTDAVAFSLGTSQELLLDALSDFVYGFTAYDALGNSYDLLSGAWFLDAVDTNTPGLYYAYAVPDLEDGHYILADGVSLPRQLCAVSIQSPGKPDINCCLSARGFLHFPWVLSADQQQHLDKFAVWLRQDSGVWTQLSEGFLFTSSDLQLSQRIFEYDSTYNLQVTYPGGQTGILTFLYDRELLISDYSEGDRDGGDTDGMDPPSSSQPASEPTDSDDASSDNNTDKTDNSDHTDNKGSSSDKAPTHIVAPTQVASIVVPLPEAAVGKTVAPSTLATDNTGLYEYQNEQNIAQPPEPPVMESYSPTETVISGLRVRDLCAVEKSVVFGMGDLTVSIPSEVLLTLHLGNSDTLSVRLTQPEQTQLVLGAIAAHQTITSLPGAVIRLRYRPLNENAEITILDATGNTIANAEFDGEFLRFPAETAGTYIISEIMPTSAQASYAKDHTILLPLACGCLLLMAGGTVVVVRRRHHA